MMKEDYCPFCGFIGKHKIFGEYYPEDQVIHMLGCSNTNCILGHFKIYGNSEEEVWEKWRNRKLPIIKQQCNPVEKEAPEYPQKKIQDFKLEFGDGVIPRLKGPIKSSGVIPGLTTDLGGLAPPHIQQSFNIIQGNHSMFRICSIKDYKITTINGTVINIKNKKIMLTVDYKKCIITIEKDDADLDKDAVIQDHYISFEITKETARKLQIKYKDILKLGN